MKQSDILIVDDMPENLQLLARMLQEKNYKVRALPSGTLALRSIEVHPPDLILLDIKMPNMDGFEVCRRIKAMPMASRIPILFISATTDKEEIVKGFELGAVDYITKPFNSHEVYQRIKTQLRLRNNEKELEALLSETVIGSIKAILDIMAFIDPDLYSKSNRLGRLMKKTVDHLNLESKWMYETAALTSTIGGILNSGMIIEKHIKELNALKIETEDIEKSRKTAADIIQNIPRMNGVAQMINGAALTNDLKDLRVFDTYTTEEKGSILLKVLESYDSLSQQGGQIEAFRQELHQAYEQWPEVVNALFEVIYQEEKAKVEYVSLDQLMSGHLVVEDIVSKTGIKLLGKGTLVTSNLKQILIKFAKQEGIHEPIVVKNS